MSWGVTSALGVTEILHKKAVSKQAKQGNVAPHWGGEGLAITPTSPVVMTWLRFESTEVWLR